MWGKVIGLMILGGLALLLGLVPPVVALFAVAGAWAGHVLVDAQGPEPRTGRAPTLRELGLDETPPRRSRPRLQPAPPVRRAPPTPHDEALAQALCPVFVELAVADGPITQSEVRVVREFFVHGLHFDEAGNEAVRQGLKRALQSRQRDVEKLVVAARPQVPPDLRPAVLVALYELALVDGELKRSESDLLKLITRAFNLSEEQVQAVTRRFLGDGQQHFATLGLEPTAGDDEVKAAFRRLAAEHHPDRVAPAQAEASAERFRQVKEAYEEIRKLRGV